MKIEDVKKLFLIITNCYQKFEFDDHKALIWHKLLENYPYKRAERNLMEHIKKNKYVPTPADIIKYDYLKNSMEITPLKERKELLLQQNTPEAHKMLQDINEELSYLTSICKRSDDDPFTFMERRLNSG